MANDFSGDVNCVAAFLVESGALTADSKGTNTLTDNNTVQSDTTNFKEGAGSAYFSDVNNEFLSILDSALNANFPLSVAAGGGTTFSFTFWLRPTANKTVFGKYQSTDGGLSCSITGAVKLGVTIFDNLGGNQVWVFGTAFTYNQWYHCAITHNASDLSYRIRIWDDTAQAQLGADLTGTATKTIDVCDDTLSIGKVLGSAELDGNIDEFVVFNDVLSVDEIDQIRAGTYGTGAVTKSGVLSESGALSRQINVNRSAIGDL